MTDPTNIDASRWLHATPVQDGAVVLTEAQVSCWRTEGHALVSNILEPNLITSLAQDAEQHFPAAGSSASERFNNFGANLVFPNHSQALTDITLHPRLLSAVAQLLDTPVTDLRLTQSDVWPKYGRSEKTGGRYDHSDQRIHVDYPNHMLTHPTEWHRNAVCQRALYPLPCRRCTAVSP